MTTDTLTQEQELVRCMRTMQALSAHAGLCGTKTRNISNLYTNESSLTSHEKNIQRHGFILDVIIDSIALINLVKPEGIEFFEYLNNCIKLYNSRMNAL